MTRPHLDNEQYHTLEQLWSHPMPSNLKWPRVLSLLKALGEVTTERGDRYRVTIDDRTEVFRPPHHHGDIPADTIMKLRHVVGPVSSQPRPGTPDSRPDLLVLLDHHSASVYQFEPSTEHLATVVPYDPTGRLRHLHHVEGHDQGRRSPEDPGYYRRIADLLRDAGTIVLLGHGDGHADAVSLLVAELVGLVDHGPEDFPKIIEARVDAKSFTESQLLSAARQALEAYENQQ